MLLSIALTLTLSQSGAPASGCSKDTDCKGDRICEAGVCVSPTPSTASSPAPPPPPPPQPTPAATTPDPAPAPEASEFPRVVRRDGQVCVQSLEVDGRVTESCRTDAPARAAPLSTSGAPRADPTDAPAIARPEVTAAVPEPASRVVADVRLHGGVLLGFAGGSAGVLADVGATVTVGGQFRSRVGVVGVGNLELGAGSSTIVVGTLGPALRVGDRTHATFTLGPSVIAYLQGSSGGAGLAGSLVVSSLFAITRAFGITVHGAVHAHALGVVITFGAGVGFGAL